MGHSGNTQREIELPLISQLPEEPRNLKNRIGPTFSESFGAKEASNPAVRIPGLGDNVEGQFSDFVGLEGKSYSSKTHPGSQDICRRDHLNIFGHFPRGFTV